MKPDHFISGTDFNKRKYNVVYAWKRNEQFLYIGSSDVGLNRIYNHNIIGVMEPVLEIDEIWLWYIEDKADRLRIEETLIFTYSPKYNKPREKYILKEKHKKRICPNCEKELSDKLRKNKIYCSSRCQFDAWNKKNPRLKLDSNITV